LRFCRQARSDLQTDKLAGLTLGSYLSQKDCSAPLINHYILPMGAAIWSMSPQEMLGFPAQMFIRFFDQHGLLSLADAPQWQYIKGGSQTYVKAILEQFSGVVRSNTKINSICRQPDGVEIRMDDGTTSQFDAVVIATHADEALGLLADPSDAERQLLGSWRYEKNYAILHTDQSVMPSNPANWASWNYTEETECEQMTQLSVTYHLNRLQNHLHTQQQYFLTLNRHQPIPSEHILQEIPFTHPIYTLESLRTQPQLQTINGVRNTYFCGSYFRYGFHEDAVKSGVAVAKMLGVTL
jgi:predicted NAD/FAD-binding protein